MSRYLKGLLGLIAGMGAQAAFATGVLPPTPAPKSPDAPLFDEEGRSTRAPDPSLWAGDPIVEGRPRPANGLTGYRVILDAGHGRTFNEQTNVWGWQRNLVYGELEDLGTPRLVNRWLTRYFENAGATAVTTRDRSENIVEIISDDSSNTPDVTTTGTWTTVPSADPDPKLSRTTAPAVAGNTFTWYATIPKKDRYAVTIFYDDLADAHTDARLVLHTASGDIEITLSQRRNFQRYLWLGEFVFPQGRQPIATLSANSDDASKVLVANVLRLGGGMGQRVAAGSTSGVPRWQENSKEHQLHSGVPDYLIPQNIGASDSRYALANWLNGDYFLQQHTNASVVQGQSTGSETVWMRTRTTDERDALVAGHARLIDAIRTRWLPSWTNRGFVEDPFGAGVVDPGWAFPQEATELAFHDRLTPDLTSLLDPDFRSITMRATYEKVALMIVGSGVVFVPEPPTAPAVTNIGGGAVRLTWEPPALGPAVDSYRVYTSTDGLAYDLGQDVGNVTTIDLDGLSEGDIRYYTIAAENAGGRSFPTETVAVKVGDGQPLLIVNGFNRLDWQVQETDNPRWFVRHHLEAFAAADPNLPIDSSSNEAVAIGNVTLDSAVVVDWILGKESLADETFKSDEQALVDFFLSGGGRLFVSGTDLALDLDTNGGTDDRDFLRRSLMTGSGGLRSITGSGQGAEGTPFAGLSFTLSNKAGEPYDVDDADRLSPTISGYTAFNWTGGGGAAVAHEAGPGKSIVLAAPLEAIVSESDRIAIAGAVLNFLRDPVVPDTTAPVVTQLYTTGLGSNSVTIRWETDEPATGVLDYGLDDTYGTSVPTTGEETRTRSIFLNGLQASTTYHFRVRAKDFLGNESTTSDFTFTTTPPETVPPEFADFQVIAYSDRDALFFWWTNEESDSQIEFGADENLGNTGPLSSTRVYRHLYLLSGLSANASYSARARSRDVNDNLGTSAIISFTTLPTISDVIVDNETPAFSILEGSFSTGAFGRSNIDYINSNYAFTTIGTDLPLARAKWTAPLPEPGLWQTAVIYRQGPNRTTSAPCILSTFDGDQLFNVNQQINGTTGSQAGQVWFNLGTPAFQTESGVLEISNQSSAAGVAMADAVRFSFRGLGEHPYWDDQVPGTNPFLPVGVVWFLY